MERASYEQGLQLDRNWIALKSKLDKDGVQRLIEHFNLISDYATGKLDLVFYTTGLITLEPSKD